MRSCWNSSMAIHGVPRITTKLASNLDIRNRSAINPLLVSSSLAATNIFHVMIRSWMVPMTMVRPNHNQSSCPLARINQLGLADKILAILGLITSLTLDLPQWHLPLYMETRRTLCFLLLNLIYISLLVAFTLTYTILSQPWQRFLYVFKGNMKAVGWKAKAFFCFACVASLRLPAWPDQK